MGDDGTPTLFTTDDTGNYVEYTPPAAPAFKDTLPEDIRESEHLQEVDGADKLARYYVDLKSNYLAPPDTADGYEFEKPEGFNLDEETFGKFKQLAFDNGVNQKQFSELMNLEVSRNEAAKEAHRKRIEDNQTQAENALKAEWGEKYEQKVESAKSILNHQSLMDDGFKDFLEDTRFGDNPQVVKFFAKLSDLISEDAFVKPGTGTERTSTVQLGEDGQPMLNFPSMDKK